MLQHPSGKHFRPILTLQPFAQGSAFVALKKWEDAALAFFEANNLEPSNLDVSQAFRDAIAEGRNEAAAARVAASS